VARPTTAARRYAEAVFELAKRDDSLDAWHDDLGTANSLLGDERVSRVVDNPSLPFAERRQVVDELIEKRVGTPMRNLISLLAERSRLDLLPAIVAEFQRLLNRERGIATAIVTSASPLKKEETAALEERLRQITGSDVELDIRIDERLIGGLTVRIGDRLLDASVRGRLERLRDQLVAGAR
jgi:F-type H+-transporting ATPase subunit delta